MKGVIHYAQGLIARGFPVSAIKRAWNKFIYEKIQQPAVRHKLTNQLIAWLQKQDFSAAFPDEENKKGEQWKKSLSHYQNTLMCGLVALNHILGALKLPQVTATYMHQVAHDMADKEVAMLYSSTPGMELDLEADSRGNFAVDILLNILREKSSQEIERWNPGSPLKGSILLVGNEQQWQAVLKDKEGQWYVFEKHSANAIQNLLSFLKGRTKYGAVYMVGELEHLQNSAYFLNFFSNAERKTRNDKNVSTRSGGEPPAKKQKKWQVSLSTGTEAFVIPDHLPRLRPKQTDNSKEPLPLPPEFQANPQFTFQPTSVIEDTPDFTRGNREEEDVSMDEGNLQVLIDAFTPTKSQGTPSKQTQVAGVHEKVRDLNGSPVMESTRPSRQRNRPLLYQSEQEEEREKHIKGVHQQHGKAGTPRDPPSPHDT